MHAHSIKINYILYNSLDDALFFYYYFFFYCAIINNCTLATKDPYTTGFGGNIRVWVLLPSERN